MKELLDMVAKEPVVRTWRPCWGKIDIRVVQITAERRLARFVGNYSGTACDQPRITKD